MNIKFLSLVIIVVGISSCKREYTTSFSRSNTTITTQVARPSTILKEEILVNTITQSKTSETPIATAIDTKEVLQKQIHLKEKKRSHSFLSETKKEIKKLAQIKKERDPRYSRALIMTIFGGLATLGGILAYGVAPTGLFIFVFGVIFIIGLISLIMYLANPKPKM